MPFGLLSLSVSVCVCVHMHMLGEVSLRMRNEAMFCKLGFYRLFWGLYLANHILSFVAERWEMLVG